MADILATRYTSPVGERDDFFSEPELEWDSITTSLGISSFETVYEMSPGATTETLHVAIDSTTEQHGFMKWNGASRTATVWSGLWREPDLWQPHGDCFVHLYKRGESRGGPAFRLSFRVLDAARCHPLFDKFLSWSPPEFPMYDTGIRPKVIPERCLYIPAPAKNEEIQSFLHHLEIRNFFAWVQDRSLVGLPNLGGALVSLLYSMNEYRIKETDNLFDVKEYMDREGYLVMKDHPDHALAVLFFAEHFRLKDLWLDAFTHCVGMCHRLSSSPEFEYISRVSKNLIDRAQMEMSVRLRSCGETLTSFLSSEDVFFGFSTAAKAHLRRFRSFLETYHAVKLGEWPPQDGAVTAFPANILVQMSEEFQKLYEYLAGEDKGVSESAMSVGGICVLQNLQAFDGRHRYEPLTHRLPRLPVFTPNLPRQQRSRPISLKRLGSGSKSDKMKPDGRLLTASALYKAANNLIDCSLVRAYRIFEQDCALAENKSDEYTLSATEGRKVRWILIYAIHQTLLSVTKIPEEVQDRKDAPYSLSVLTVGCPPWTEEEEGSTDPNSDPEKEILAVKDDFEFPSSFSPYSSDCLQPDIDYSRTTSFPTKSNACPPRISPLKTKVTSRRRMSLPNIGSLTPLGKKAVIAPKTQQKPSFCEIIIHGYGNGSRNFKEVSFSLPTMIEIDDGGSIIASIREIIDEEHTPDRSSLSSSNSSRSRYSVPSIWGATNVRSPNEYYRIEDSDEENEVDDYGKGAEAVRQAHQAIPFFDELRMNRESLDDCYEAVCKEEKLERSVFL